MAITAINVQKRDMLGSWTSTGVRQYRVVLQCISNDPNDEVVSVLNAVCDHLDIPIGTPTYVSYNFGNSVDLLAMLKKIEVRQTAQSSPGEYKEWLAVLDYDSTAEQLQDNPLLRPTIISGNFQEYMKTVWKDINGKAIANAAKRKLDPPLEIPDGRFILSMTRNEIDYDPGYFANNFYNRINSAPWFEGSPGQWRCSNIAGTGPHIENNVVFYTITYEFQFHVEGWQPQFANAGTLDIKGNPVVDNAGNPVTSPAPLNSDGTQVFGTILDSDWTFITAQCFYQADFNALGLP